MYHFRCSGCFDCFCEEKLNKQQSKCSKCGGQLVMLGPDGDLKNEEKLEERFYIFDLFYTNDESSGRFDPNFSELNRKLELFSGKYKADYKKILYRDTTMPEFFLPYNLYGEILPALLYVFAGGKVTVCFPENKLMAECKKVDELFYSMRFLVSSNLQESIKKSYVFERGNSRAKMHLSSLTNKNTIRDLCYRVQIFSEENSEKFKNFIITYQDMGISSQYSFKINQKIKENGNKKICIASLLLQGEIFFQLWKKRLLKPIYWCTRTRIPSAFAASKRYNNIYPYIDAPEKNQRLSSLSTEIATTVYGKHISLCASTYLLKDSYQRECQFLMLPTSTQSGKIFKYFQNHIDYSKNQAIFILSKLSQRTLAHYIINTRMPTINDVKESLILANDVLKQYA